MKKLVVVLGALALLSVPALAVSLAVGDTLAEGDDHSCLYYGAQVGAAAGLPIGLLPGIPNGTPPPNYFPDASSLAIGNTQKTIFRVRDITDSVGNSEWNYTTSPTELTGILVDLQLINVTPLSATRFILDFGVLTPNPDNPVAAPGGIMQIYEDAAKNYNADPGGAGMLTNALSAPSVALSNANMAPNQWTGYSFPTVTDGSLWLDARLVDLSLLNSVGVYVLADDIPIMPGTVLREEINFGSGQSSGIAYADVFGGSFAPMIEQGYIKDQYGNSTIADLSLNFLMVYPIFNTNTGNWQDINTYTGPGYWTVDSNDRTDFGVVPEPATMTLLGLALAGFGLRCRRKK